MGADGGARGTGGTTFAASLVPCSGDFMSSALFDAVDFVEADRYIAGGAKAFLLVA